uniref:Uncharacterized protein n=1 Tax=Arundo donax TaxID=35708 RepID=A0A0A9FDP0_ARUDO
MINLVLHWKSSTKHSYVGVLSQQNIRMWVSSHLIVEIA